MNATQTTSATTQHHPIPAPGPWLRIEDAAQVSKFSKQTIRRALRREGSARLTGYKIGHEWRIRVEDLDAWLRRSAV